MSVCVCAGVCVCVRVCARAYVCVYTLYCNSLYSWTWLFIVTSFTEMHQAEDGVKKTECANTLRP